MRGQQGERPQRDIAEDAVADDYKQQTPAGIRMPQPFFIELQDKQRRQQDKQQRIFGSRAYDIAVQQTMH